MKNTISKIIFIIGALIAIGMLYFLAVEETNKLFYVLMLISFSTWPLAQYIGRKRKKDIDSEIPGQ